jgi:chromosome segregation ATPase
MVKVEIIVRLATTLFFLFALTGCDRSAKERDRAIAETQKLRAELIKIKVALEKIQNERDELNTNYTITSEELEDAQAERDSLRESLAIISKELESTKLKLASAMQTQDDLEYQIAELTRQQNAAVASGQGDQSMIERLANQLEEKDGTISELEQLNIELQATIQELQNYMEQMGEQVEEEPQEEFEEQYEEEVYDQNDI